MTEHPITPPPELVRQWLTEFYSPDPVPEMAPREEELDRRFETWWYNEGSGMAPRADEDCEELVRRVSRIAWRNGAYCALSLTK